MQIGQINFVFQIMILAVIFAGLTLKKKGKFRLHGTLMLVGVILNLGSFLIVMGPSLLVLEITMTQPLQQFSLVTLAHAIIGGTAIVLATFLVVAWHLQASTQNCARRKKLMKTTFILWALALVLGVLVYYYLYGI